MKKILFYALTHMLERKLSRSYRQPRYRYYGDRGHHGYKMGQSFSRKLKLVAAFAFFFVLAFGGLAVWGTVSLVGGLLKQMEPARVERGWETSQGVLKGVVEKPLTTSACLTTVAGLVSPELLTVSLKDNYQRVKSACWETRST